MDEKPQILARVIIEMLGTPKEHIEKTMNDFIETLKGEREVKTVHLEPAKEQENFFSIFAEIELYFPNLQTIFGFCFDNMPSSIEILEPANLAINNNTLSNALNDLQAKNHEVDMLIKNLKSTNKLLDDNAMTLFRNFVKYLLKEGEKSAEEISEAIMIPTKDLQPFLSRLIEANIISLKEGKYVSKNE